MGSIFSSSASYDEEAPPVVYKPRPYHNTKRTPREESLHPDDCRAVYASIFDLVEVVVHQDRTSVIVFSECDPDDALEDRDWTMGHEFVRHMRQMNERLADAGSHPRIVKYLGPLRDDGSNEFRLERLNPGPIRDIKLPLLSIPLPTDLASRDRILLALFYRWALQTLSALHFIHSQSMLLSDFSMESIWLREDFSAAITGFLHTSVPTWCPYPGFDQEQAKPLEPVPQEIIESPPIPIFVDDDQNVFDRGGEQYTIELRASLASGPTRLESIQYGDPEDTGYPGSPSKKYDLFDWATWMWRVMSNHCSMSGPPRVGGHCVEPRDPINLEERPQFATYAADREYRQQQAWQVLEGQRLGHVFVRAWNGEYEDAMEATRDVKAIVKSMNMTLVGDDEICIDGVEWDKAFTILGEGQEKVMSFASPPPAT